MKDSIQHYINTLIVSKKPFTWEGLNVYLRVKAEKDTFIEFIENSLNERKDLRPNTRKNHRSLINSLKNARKIVEFADLTLQKIKEYDSWMHEQGYKQTSIATRHKALKIYITEAIRQERIDKNPYTFFKIDQGKPLYENI